MTTVIAAIVLIGGVGVLNLMLTLGLIRRLREHTQRLNQLSAGRTSASDLRMAVGERPGDFEATAVDGRQVATTSMADLELVGFFSHRCPPCKEWIPRFVDAAGELPDSRNRTLAVLVGSDADAADLVSQLSAVATVVTEDTDGPVSQAFGVQGYPTMYRLAADRTIVAADPREVVTTSAVR